MEQLTDQSDFIAVDGIWLRRIGDEVQVLADVGGAWRLVITEHADGNYSHIVEPAGIRSACVFVLSSA